MFRTANKRKMRVTSSLKGLQSWRPTVKGKGQEPHVSGPEKYKSKPLATSALGRQRQADLWELDAVLYKVPGLQ